MELLLIMTVIGDLILAGTWMPFYFRTGIPIFIVRLNHRHVAPNLAERLSSGFRGGGVPSILFRTLSEREIAFRESFRSSTFLRYTPVMRGLIRDVPEKRVTYVIGWINWWIVALFGFALRKFLISPDSVPLILIPAFAGVFILIYGGQAYRFRKVADMISGR